MVAHGNADGETSAAAAREALQRSERVRSAGGEIARRAIRVHLLRQGVFMALAVLAIGAINAWLRQTWSTALAVALAVGVLSWLTDRAARGASVRAVPGVVWSALVAGASAAIAALVWSALDGPVPAPVAVAAAAVAAFAVWAVWAAAGWRAPR